MTTDLLTRIDLLYKAYMDPAVKGREGRFRRLAEALIEGWPALSARAGPDAWISVTEKLPGPGVHVIAFYLNALGKDRRIRAMWVPQFFMEDGGEFHGETDYNEADDTNYWPEGWYETNEHEEVNWLVDEDVTHWQPLPAPPRQIEGEKS